MRTNALLLFSLLTAAEVNGLTPLETLQSLTQEIERIHRVLEGLILEQLEMEMELTRLECRLLEQGETRWRLEALRCKLGVSRQGLAQQQSDFGRELERALLLLQRVQYLQALQRYLERLLDALARCDAQSLPI